MSNEIDGLVDSFVSMLVAAGVPIRVAQNAKALTELEEKLAARLPQSFESLLSRYSFPTFDVCGLTLFGWNSNWESTEYFSSATGPKGSLAELLLPARLVQIGRPDTGDFDAICLDGKDKAQNRDQRIVRVDHEEVLRNGRVRVVSEFAPSFRKFVETVLSSSAPKIYLD